MIWLYYLLAMCVLIFRLCPRMRYSQTSREVVSPQHLIKSKVTVFSELREKLCVLEQVETVFTSVVCFWTAAEM